jgi:hypothetical protein
VFRGPAKDNRLIQTFRIKGKTGECRKKEREEKDEHFKCEKMSLFLPSVPY